MPIRQQYEARVRAGGLERDPAQAKIVALLEALGDELDGYAPARKSSALGWLVRAKAGGDAPRGLYVWGGVGRGKSMLMDMFFDHVAVAKKRRVHLHAFMAEVHAAIYAHRQAVKRGTAKGEDPIEPVAESIARAAHLLCFDEFTVTDIADAMIIGRLFKVLFARGVVVVATSNVDPDDLYKDGLNRSLFMETIELIHTHMDVVKLESRTDYRMEKLAGSTTFHVPADAEAEAALTRTFETLTGRPTGKPGVLKINGRELPVPQQRGNVARFAFADLCGKPLGAQDYLAVAKRFHSVIIDGIPKLAAEQRYEVQRFVRLIDAFYEARVKLFASAEADAAGLFADVDSRDAFECERTISRLVEMRSSAYIGLPHGGAARDGTAGIVDT